MTPDRATGIAPFMATLLGIPVPEEQAHRVGYLQPPQVREKIFLATLEFLGSVARLEPLVLVFEDLHWSDPTSMDLLEALMPLTDQAPLMIVGVFRPLQQDPGWRFHEFASRDYLHRYTSILLEPLDEDNSALW